MTDFLKGWRNSIKMMKDTFTMQLSTLWSLTLRSWVPFSNVIYQCSLQFHHECPFPMSYISVLYNSITNALFQCHISVFPTIPSWMPFSNVISHFINSIMNTCCQCHIPISQTILSWISFPMLYVSFSYNSIMNALFLVLFQ